mmetsp:Transcript_51474/g.133750  ORF Transcript_51474/g.133750 Transcript_51474/m.133750 type:complete len:231 (-) Transcript_51474:231-923(-)
MVSNLKARLWKRLLEVRLTNEPAAIKIPLLEKRDCIRLVKFDPLAYVLERRHVVIISPWGVFGCFQPRFLFGRSRFCLLAGYTFSLRSSCCFFGFSPLGLFHLSFCFLFSLLLDPVFLELGLLSFPLCNLLCELGLLFRLLLGFLPSLLCCLCLSFKFCRRLEPQFWFLLSLLLLFLARDWFFKDYLPVRADVKVGATDTVVVFCPARCQRFHCLRHGFLHSLDYVVPPN